MTDLTTLAPGRPGGPLAEDRADALVDLVVTPHTDTSSAPDDATSVRAARLRYALRHLTRRPGLVVAVLWLVAVLVAAVAPSVLASGDPLAGVPAEKLTGPSAQHWFGTDQLGRDLYTRVVHGTGTTVRAALLAIAIGLVVGSVLGLLAGFVGGTPTPCSCASPTCCSRSPGCCCRWPS